MARRDTSIKIRNSREVEMVGEASEFRRITSKGQVTIPNLLRKRYKITTDSKLEFLPLADGILVRSATDEGSFEELAGSASKDWTVDQMLRRLHELREENA